MRAWAWMMGGLIVWAIHFLGVYVIASVADVVATADDPWWRAAGLVFSGACLLASAILAILALRRLGGTRAEVVAFGDQLAALGAVVATVGIAWQALPNVIGY